jgi:serine phosphatase RsbU (regulator of sigma subunit)
MEATTDRINRALAGEEVRAERFANYARLVVLVILTFVLLLNVGSLSVDATLMNASALLIGYLYGLGVFIRIRRRGYHPSMKYLTSCLDILLVFLLLFLYTRIEIPAVALKNYVFYVVYPLIALTVFRYDRKLTLAAGGLAFVLYLLLILSLFASGRITFTYGGYEQELFSTEVTYVGQLTKVLILCGYVLLLSFLAQYSRRVFVKLVREESNLRHQKELTEWEMNIASEVQATLVPGSFPQIRGLDCHATVQQGRYVGGDYCDLLALDDHTMLVVTADVSGKGVPAALVMAEVRASVHLLAPTRIELEVLARRLNTLLHQSTTKKDYVTFFTAVIDVSRKTLRYVNAGHPPPLVSSAGMVRSLSQRTIALGLSSSLPQLNEIDLEFSPGSILVTYTDGLLEQMNSEEEQFGEIRLRQFIQTHDGLDARSFVEQLLAELREFAKGTRFDDDVGITVVRFP